MTFVVSMGWISGQEEQFWKIEKESCNPWEVLCPTAARKKKKWSVKLKHF